MKVIPVHAAQYNFKKIRTFVIHKGIKRRKKETLCTLNMTTLQQHYQQQHACQRSRANMFIKMKSSIIHFFLRLQELQTGFWYFFFLYFILPARTHLANIYWLIENWSFVSGSMSTCYCFFLLYFREISQGFVVASKLSIIDPTSTQFHVMQNEKKKKKSTFEFLVGELNALFFVKVKSYSV